MSTSPPPTNEEQPRDAAYWSSSGSSLKVTNIPSCAVNLNVVGRQVVGGWITFSANEVDDYIVVEAQVLMRANDPIYEIGLRFGGHKQENVFWQPTLKSLAAFFQRDAPVEMQVTCIDPRLQWSQSKNMWHNAAMRTVMYTMTAPTRWIRGKKS